MKAVKYILFLLITISQHELYSQKNDNIDTLLIQEFFDYKFSDLYNGNANICIHTLPVAIDFFDCTSTKYVNGKTTTPTLTKGIACKYLNNEDIKYMKSQIEREKNIQLDDFKYLKKNYQMIDCDTLKSEIVINKFSLPLFSIDKKTALLIYTDEISNTGCQSYRINLYKKDNKNRWHFFVELFRMETD